MIDIRRGDTSQGMFTALQHGDVYELATVDPERYPLPSIEFLNMRYTVRCIMAGAKTREALADLKGISQSARVPGL